MLVVVIGCALTVGFAVPLTVGAAFAPSLQPIRDLAEGNGVSRPATKADACRDDGCREACEEAAFLVGVLAVACGIGYDVIRL